MQRKRKKEFTAKKEEKTERWRPSVEGVGKEKVNKTLELI